MRNKFPEHVLLFYGPGRANHAVSVHVCKSKHFIRQSPWPAAGPMTGRCKLGVPAEAQRNNQSALESSITLPLPTYRPESQLTKRKNVLRSDAALRKNCVFQEKCASDWTHKFLKNASLLIKKGPKRTNAGKIRSLI